MIKKLIPIIFLVLALPILAQAHVLKSDGNIGVLMHVDPNDDPIINQPASFFFEISDKTKQFTPANCNCTVTISQNGKQIYTTDLFANTIVNSVNAAPFFSYTFTAKDVYQIVVAGNPKTPNAFQPFSVNFDLRVARTAGQSATNSSDSLIWVVAGVAIAAIIIGLLYFGKRKKLT